MTEGKPNNHTAGPGKPLAQALRAIASKVPRFAVTPAIGVAITLALPSSPIAIQKQARVSATHKRPRQQWPGERGTSYLLPNGWRLSPAGTHIKLGDFPINLASSADGRYIIATNNGAGLHSVQIVHTARGEVAQTIPLEKAWLGLTFAPDGQRFYVSAGADNKVLIYAFKDGKAELLGEIKLGGPKEDVFAGGLAVSPDGATLYVACNLAHGIAVADTRDKRVITRIAVGEYPYSCVPSSDGRELYVSNWGSATVSVIDTATNAVTGKLATGDHPNDLALSKDGKRLFVACANVNRVDVIDLSARKVTESISMSLTPRAPAGTTPNGLAVSPDGTRLYVANADNNNVALVDISKAGESRVQGFIPTGWYPTAVRVSPDGSRIYVANGKGLGSMPNGENGPNPYSHRAPGYVATLLTGALSTILTPNHGTLARYTRQVYDNTPYVKQDTAPPNQGPTAIPRRAGNPSPIKHVIYIIKENRTYDQVFGDIKEGNGDAKLCLFGEEITPNLHSLARQFVLLDNFYTDAEVSADGHNWSTAAYATDYVEKTWPTVYSSRGRSYDYEGQKEISAPSLGYIWDYCKRRGVSYRSYGEFIEEPASGDPKPRRARVKALEGHFAADYPGWNLAIKDQARVDAWLKEFREFEQNGRLPQFQVVRLGNDHTAYLRPRFPTPKAMVADNDYAVGRLVEAVSNSRYWRDTAIFVIEDDAQNGPDHVDAHRTVGLVISAYTKRGFVDSTMYSTSSMLRTMELILDLPPMSQYDAGAAAMFNSFTSQRDLTPFKALRPSVNLDELNPPHSRDAHASMQANLDEADSVPDLAFNEILWRAIKGEGVPMPAPVRAVFVRPIDER